MSSKKAKTETKAVKEEKEVKSMLGFFASQGKELRNTVKEVEKAKKADWQPIVDFRTYKVKEGERGFPFKILRDVSTKYNPSTGLAKIWGKMLSLGDLKLLANLMEEQGEIIAHYLSCSDLKDAPSGDASKVQETDVA